MIMPSFSKLDIPAAKEINHIIILEKRITSKLKLLQNKEIIDKSSYKSIKPVGSRPGIWYGLGKNPWKNLQWTTIFPPYSFGYGCTYLQTSKVFNAVF